jgi:hypothetical protein
MRSPRFGRTLLRIEQLALTGSAKTRLARARVKGAAYEDIATDDAGY